MEILIQLHTLVLHGRGVKNLISRLISQPTNITSTFSAIANSERFYPIISRPTQISASNNIGWLYSAGSF